MSEKYCPTAADILPSIEIIENHKVVPEMVTIIDDVYQDLKKIFSDGGISERDFVEYRGRLWARREEACDALLKQNPSPKAA